jgi:hypothetical protein
MCIIVDANVAHKFSNPPHRDVRPVVSWLRNKKPRQRLPRLVVGGKLREELHRAGEVIRKFLLELRRAGRLYDIADDEVNEETQTVVRLLKKLQEKSDDPHVLALARVSGSRLLASDDSRSGLHALFKDKRLLDPPGQVYRKAKHQHLLREAPDCKNVG